MISPRLLSKDEVAAQMEALGYERAEESIEGHSCWRTPWNHHFLVIELPPDGMTPEWALAEQIGEVKLTVPTYN